MMVSVVIPTRNEAAHIASLITYLRALPQSECLEILVCDGQSTDNTPQRAQEAGARVRCCEQANRGAQQNAGARESGGEVLWFLHADARPHRRSVEYLLRAATKREIIGGHFRLSFDGTGYWPRVFEFIARVQARRGIFYGDSGIWARREVFERLGGFQNWPLFEDYDFVRRLRLFARRHGVRVEYSPLPIHASSRRFARQPTRVLRRWAWLQILFHCGVAPRSLAQIYHPPTNERGR